MSIVREVDLGYEERFPMHWAAICGDLGTIQQFLAKGWDPNMPDEFRDTPMHGAVLNDQTEIIRALFQAGGSIFIRNMHKLSPMDVATNNKKRCLSVLQDLAATPQGQAQFARDANQMSQQKDEFGRRKVYDLSQASMNNLDAPTQHILRQAVRKPLMEWSVEEVAAWIATCRLSKTPIYQSLIAQHAIDGEVLYDMRTKEDWAQLGITVFGDVRKLIRRAQLLR